MEEAWSSCDDHVWRSKGREPKHGKFKNAQKKSQTFLRLRLVRFSFTGRPYSPEKNDYSHQKPLCTGAGDQFIYCTAMPDTREDSGIVYRIAQGAVHDKGYHFCDIKTPEKG